MADQFKEDYFGVPSHVSFDTHYLLTTERFLRNSREFRS